MEIATPLLEDFMANPTSSEVTTTGSLPLSSGAYLNLFEDIEMAKADFKRLRSEGKTVFLWHRIDDVYAVHDGGTVSNDALAQTFETAEIIASNDTDLESLSTDPRLTRYQALMDAFRLHADYVEEYSADGDTPHIASRIEFCQWNKGSLVGYQVHDGRSFESLEELTKLLREAHKAAAD